MDDEFGRFAVRKSKKKANNNETIWYKEGTRLDLSHDLIVDKMRTFQPQTADAAGLLVEHSKEAFLEGRDTVLVLKDKGILLVHILFILNR